MPAEHSHRWLTRFVALLVLTAGYLYGYPSATITYAAVDLLHIAAGAVVTLLLLVYFFRLIRIASTLARLGWLFLTAGAFLGCVLVKIGTPHRLRAWLFAHIGLCLLGTFFLAAAWCDSRGWFGTAALTRVIRFASLAILTAAISFGLWWTREVGWRDA